MNHGLNNVMGPAPPPGEPPPPPSEPPPATPMDGIPALTDMGPVYGPMLPFVIVGDSGPPAGPPPTAPPPTDFPDAFGPPTGPVDGPPPYAVLATPAAGPAEAGPTAMDTLSMAAAAAVEDDEEEELARAMALSLAVRSSTPPPPPPPALPHSPSLPCLKSSLCHCF